MTATLKLSQLSIEVTVPGAVWTLTVDRRQL